MKLQSVYPILSLATALLLTVTQAFAHGESHPGPHGGFVRMPGSFHTEVIPQKNGFKIMLLDINFQNPSVKNSSIQAMLKYDHHALALKCSTQSDYFFCAAARKTISEAKTLDVIAVRENTKGMPIQYSLPLRLG
jgi:hypothetical protein